MTAEWMNCRWCGDVVLFNETEMLRNVRACRRCRHERAPEREHLHDVESDVPASEAHYNGAPMPDGWGDAC